MDFSDSLYVFFSVQVPCPMAHVSVFPPECLPAWSPPFLGRFGAACVRDVNLLIMVLSLGDAQPDRQPGGWCHHGLGRYLAVLSRHHVGQFVPLCLPSPLDGDGDGDGAACAWRISCVFRSGRRCDTTRCTIRYDVALERRRGLSIVLPCVRAKWLCGDDA
jgi:hypothetical protein